MNPPHREYHGRLLGKDISPYLSGYLLGDIELTITIAMEIGDMLDIEDYLTIIEEELAYCIWFMDSHKMFEVTLTLTDSSSTCYHITYNGNFPSGIHDRALIVNTIAEYVGITLLEWDITSITEIKLFPYQQYNTIKFFNSKKILRHVKLKNEEAGNS